MDYRSVVREAVRNSGIEGVISIDIETLMPPGTLFLSGERIIAISVSWATGHVNSQVYMAEDDTPDSEYNILDLLNTKLREMDPQIIIGYNHTGYDIPLIQMKVKHLEYSRRLRDIEKAFGTAYCLDMMYPIAEDLGKYDGDFYIRKLEDVVSHEAYSHLNLSRNKSLVKIPDKSKGEAIIHLWKNDRDKFLKYCIGDTRDLMLIFMDMFGLNSSKL